jgi:predicted aspartyl protease
MNGSSMMIPVTLEGLNNLQGCSITGLIDSGATGGFINESVVEEQGMEREALPIPVPVYNADGTLNKGGLITHVVRL